MIAEMLDGAVFVSPSPGFAHQDAALSLAVRLRAGCPPGLRVLVAPFAVRLGPGTEVRPDVLVARYADLTSDGLTCPPLLAVEVASPASTLVDRSLKRAVYARAGVASYWLLDPEVPMLTVLELTADGDYAQAAEVRGGSGYDARRPFGLRVVPLDLVAGLHP